MPFPRWVARLNRRFVNGIMMHMTRRPPFAALTHVGRSSGRRYTIPINAFPTSTGFCLALTYGKETDWVRNVLAAQSAVLEFDGERIELIRPRIVPEVDARPFLPSIVRGLLGVFRVRDFLMLDAIEPETTT